MAVTLTLFSRCADGTFRRCDPSVGVSIPFSHESLNPGLMIISRKRNTASRVLNASVTLLFLSSTLGVITYVILLSLLLRIGVGTPPSRYLTLISKLDIVHAVTARLNVRPSSFCCLTPALLIFPLHWQYIISDAIVVWRAWILWPNNRIAQALLLVCMAYSTGTLRSSLDLTVG